MEACLSLLPFLAVAGSIAAQKHPITVCESSGAPAGLVAGAEFGAAVASHGRWSVVGAPGDGVLSGQGHVYVAYYGTPVAKLEADVPAIGQRFGQAVDVFQRSVVVGAPGDGAGSVFAFEYQVGAPSRFVSLNRLTVSGAVLFGSAVAVDGDTLVVGAPDPTGGRAFVYQFAGNWQLVAELTSSLDLTNGSFGAAVDIHGSVIAVGVPGKNRVHVYERAGGVWPSTETAVLSPSDPSGPGGSTDRFGHDVAVNQGVVAVVSKFILSGGTLMRAHGYVFRSTGGWGDMSIPFTVHGGVSLFDGGDPYAIGVQDSWLVLGSAGPVDTWAPTGMYFEEAVPGTWFATELFPFDASPGDGFGASVAIHGNRVLYGAPGFGGAGSLYAMQLPGWDQPTQPGAPAKR